MWHKMEKLKYDVVRHGKVVISAGTPNVEIWFRAAKWTYVNDDNQIVYGNLYRINGKIY